MPPAAKKPRKRMAKDAVSARMRLVKGANTAPERFLRAALRAAGHHTGRRALPGKPDLQFAAARLAIFVDGDFWHGNQWRRRGFRSLEEQLAGLSNEAYWLKKIRRNMARDIAHTRTLLAQGWRVLRLWESSLKSTPSECINMALKAIETPTRPAPVSLLAEMSVAEFFAGIGLMRMGLEQAGWRTVFANDLDPGKRAMYTANFPDADSHFALEDIHTLPAKAVPDVTLATASFPCTDLSLAGARKGIRAGESSAFWGFIAYLKSKGARRPPLVLLENVLGFLSSHAGEDFEAALLALNGLGYAVDVIVLDAARFVPQSRVRMFVIGHQRAAKRAEAPALAAVSTLRPRALTQFIAAHPHIDWALRDLPEPPSTAVSLPDLLEPLPAEDPRWWSETRAAYLLGQMSPKHRAEAAAMIAGRRWRYATVFRRVRKGTSMAELRTDGIAGCLRTPKGGSGRQILLKMGHGAYAARLLTPRECARLMGADEYKIDVAPSQAYFGFGDAVCVPAITWIATYYLGPLLNELLRGAALSPLKRAS